MNEYEKIMSRITVTDEMKQRILKNIQETNNSCLPGKKHFFYHDIKKLLPVAACFALLLTGMLTVHHFSAPNDPEVATVVNDMVEVSSAKELADRVGFEIEELSELPFHADETIYTAYGEDLGEITYIGEEQTITFRKSVGEEDNSGDYTNYGTMIDDSISGTNIHLKGEGDVFYLAVWNRNGFSYSVSVQKGISETAFTNILTGIISDPQ